MGLILVILPFLALHFFLSFVLVGSCDLTGLELLLTHSQGPRRVRRMDLIVMDFL